MKYCTKCGAKMSDDALFCSNCGCKVTQPEELDKCSDNKAPVNNVDVSAVIDDKTVKIPISGSSTEKDETSEKNNETSEKVQFSIPNQIPPLLTELSLMYEKMAKYSLVTGIVEVLGAVDMILLGSAFVAQPERLLIFGILFIIYGIGSVIVSVFNFVKYAKEHKFSQKCLSNPPQAIKEAIDLFQNDDNYKKYLKSTESLDTLNIVFRFYKDKKYSEKYEYMNAFIRENSEQLSYILSAYNRNYQNDIAANEMSKLQNAFSAFPKTNYSSKMKIRIRSVLVGICFVILIPVLIILNKAVRDPEYAKYIGENYGHTNPTAQQTANPPSYTAEEFINRYNELASNFDGVVDTFDYSTSKKEKNKDDLWIYSFSDTKNEKALSLMVDGNGASEKVVSVCMSFYLSEDDEPVYRYDVANAVTVFIKNLSLADAYVACELTAEKGEYTNSQISGIILYYEKDSSNNTENWLIFLSDKDSTTVQLSNETDTKAEESSKVSEKETSTIQTSEASKVKETSETFHNQDSSKNDSQKTIYPQEIYDRVVEILHDDAYRDMDLEYSFGHIIGSDDLFMFVKRGNTTASRFISAYEITDESVYVADEAFSGGANSLYVNEKDQVGIYYAKQGYSYYGIVTYEYGKLIHHTEYSSDESSMSVPSPVPGEWIKWASVRDLSLAKEMLLGDAEFNSGIIYSDEVLYSQMVFYYDGVTYYTPTFSGYQEGHLNFPTLGNEYKALPLPEYADNYGRQIDIDSFVIINDVVYFTNQSPGSVSPLPASLYKMNLDGSDFQLIQENVDIRFFYENGKIYYSDCYDEYRPQYTDNNAYCYDISTGQKNIYGHELDLSRANLIFADTINQVEYHDGIYFRENTFYYRTDKLTGFTQNVGYNVGGGQQ